MKRKKKKFSKSVLIDHLVSHISTLQPLDLVKLVENYDESKSCVRTIKNGTILCHNSPRGEL